jgi:hypothetical protein
MKTLIMLLLISSSAIADETIHVIHSQLTPDQTDLMLKRIEVSDQQQAINNARYSQMRAEQYEAQYERWRQYQNGRVDTERFISHAPRQ